MKLPPELSLRWLLFVRYFGKFFSLPLRVFGVDVSPINPEDQARISMALPLRHDPGINAGFKGVNDKTPPQSAWLASSQLQTVARAFQGFARIAPGHYWFTRPQPCIGF